MSERRNITILMNQIHQGNWKAPALNTRFNNELRRWVSPDAPTFAFTAAATTTGSCQCLMFISLFQLDFRVVHNGNAMWDDTIPKHEDDTCGVIIYYGEFSETKMIPAKTINQAALLALLQLCLQVVPDRRH